ncbi:MULTISPECIES: TonB-dependent receptor [unclassified Sphingopyxis]|uniref:TonB-dependent receptor n=1 Tax=unclassified Sphingopyxis TaxID=2614943 RepID=UPI0007311079|nr:MULTISPECIES: TonB-dependent receptor [unclassified Sphingopyxis]KTE02465.1 TonB-dependent receptor [Sphingopyxis sp. H012]KTE09550.1 TonB-dependent receptor [Sphingopyxis sp. H093]KTE11026.1 TonB-dependent receptor [Sphingopyxis sp. H053]KTE30510.1 TonB-dependent receptor [Sphingopyxis sp. H080]KTE35514.1 TonB-dependent receptor [Sphingopyxis sp. H038]
MNARASMLAGLSCLALASTPAVAQDAPANSYDGNEIIVTATKRDASLQDVPFSINAQTEQAIERANASTVEDLSRNVAGLTVQNLGPGQSQVSVRGVSAGQIARDQPGVKEQVGVYLDESVVSLSLFTPDLDLFDLNRVETLRGPQGTLFGSGSVGGTLRYITNQPNLDGIEGKVEGNVNLVDGDDFGGHLKGAINLPLSPNLAMRAVGYYTRYAGFINALREGGGESEDVNSGERYGGRFSLLWKPAENLSITPRFVYQKVKTDGFNRQEVYNLFANQFTTTRPQVTFKERQQYLLLDEAFEDEVKLFDLTMSYDGDVIGVTSVTTYTDRDILVSRDASALTGSVSADLGFPVAGILLPSNLVDTTGVKQFTQELRVNSAGTGPFQWLVGGYYANVKRDYTQRLPTPGYDVFTDARFGAGTSAALANGFGPDSPYNADIPYDLSQIAIFGELSYDLTEAFTATLGGRYYAFDESRRFVSGGLFPNGDNARDKTSSTGFSPRLLLSYDVADGITLNAQASKGFRLGGVNDPLNLPLCDGGVPNGPDAQTFSGRPRYDDETLWNYEGGVKAQFGGITFNAAGFYTKINNLQVTADAGSCSSRIVFNADAHTMGLEVELSASPFTGLDLGLSGSYVEAEFDSTLTRPNGTVIEGIREGNRLPSVPKFQMAANATYSFPIDASSDTNAFVTASFQHVGSRYTQPGDQENNPRTFVHGFTFGGAPIGSATTLDLKLPDYQLVNLGAGIEFPNEFEISVYVNNLLDENALLAFDRERGGRARLGFATNQPRTFGVTVRKGF